MHASTSPDAEQAGLDRLRVALSSVAGALAGSDLEQLLACEPELASALEAALAAPRSAITRTEIARTRAELLRCRRLGASLVAFTQLSLDPDGAQTYSRSGSAPIGVRAASVEARG